MTVRQKLTRWFLAASVLLVVGLGGAALWQQFSLATTAELEPTGNPPLEVQTQLAERVESYTRQRTYTGIIREARRSRVSFQRAGEVIGLLVDEGQHVQQGQQLASLDDRHILARKAQLTAQLAEAQAVLDELLAGPRQETIAAKRKRNWNPVPPSLSATYWAKAAGCVAEQLVRDHGSVSREEYETFFV